MNDFNLEGYVDVAERVEAFYKKYPDGSLQGRHWVQTVGDKVFVVFRAEAYRKPDDPRPGVGHAWEPFPGKTPYTQDSELMVGETSAWGRAIASLGFEVRKGIASRQEVQNRSGDGRQAQTTPSDRQLDFLDRLVKKLGADNPEQIRAYVKANLTGGKNGTASKAIDVLNGDDDAKRGEAVLELSQRADAWDKRTNPDVESEMPGEPDPGMTLEEAVKS